MYDFWVVLVPEYPAETTISCRTPDAVKKVVDWLQDPTASIFGKAKVYAPGSIVPQWVRKHVVVPR